jgi:hypothetical protein
LFPIFKKNGWKAAKINAHSTVQTKVFWLFFFGLELGISPRIFVASVTGLSGHPDGKKVNIVRKYIFYIERKYIILIFGVRHIP